MKINNINFLRYTLALTAMLLLVNLPVVAQQSNSLYFMKGIPQSNQLNPATQPRYNVYVGFPLLSSIEINGGNSAIGFNDVFLSNYIKDSLVYPLYNETTRNNFLGKFSKSTSAYSDLRIDLLSFGFRVNDSYFSFSVGDRMESYFTIPHDLIDLGVNFNLSSVPSAGGKKSFDFSGLGVNTTWYREYALGISQKVNDNIYFGLKGKLLFGKANITSNDSKIYIKDASSDSWKLQSVMEINSSVPKMNVYYSTANKLDSVKFDTIQGRDIYNIVLNHQNIGAAIDMGIIFKPVKSLSISASIIDLGFIHWKNNINSLVQTGTYNYNGIPVSTKDSVNLGTAFMDTLKKSFTYTHDNDPYITTLSGKVYLGVYYQPVSWVGFGALSRFQRLNSIIDKQYTFSLNLFPESGFNMTLSYTIADKMYDNLAFAICQKLGPMQLYFMSERIPLYWDKNTGSGIPFLPAYAKNVNFHMGINFVFGTERNKKLKKDKPLVEI